MRIGTENATSSLPGQCCDQMHAVWRRVGTASRTRFLCAPCVPRRALGRQFKVSRWRTHTTAASPSVCPAHQPRPPWRSCTGAAAPGAGTASAPASANHQCLQLAVQPSRMCSRSCCHPQGMLQFIISLQTIGSSSLALHVHFNMFLTECLFASRLGSTWLDVSARR